MVGKGHAAVHFSSRTKRQREPYMGRIRVGARGSLRSSSQACRAQMGLERTSEHVQTFYGSEGVGGYAGRTATGRHHQVANLSRGVFVVSVVSRSCVGARG